MPVASRDRELCLAVVKRCQAISKLASIAICIGSCLNSSAVLWCGQSGGTSMKSIAFHVFSPMVRLASYAPRGRLTLMGFFIRLASNDDITPSVYGPIFQTRWHDATFRFCVFGSYGTYLSDFLTNYSKPFFICRRWREYWSLYACRSR